MTALDDYLAGLDPIAVPVVRALDLAVRKAHPDFDVAIKYRILMYTLDADWRTWVCAIDAGSRRVSLKFLYGVMLDDPRRVLRAGTSVLKSWDFGFDAAVDAAGVGAYVREAVRRHPEYKADAPRILAAARRPPIRG